MDSMKTAGTGGRIKYCTDGQRFLTAYPARLALPPNCLARILLHPTRLPCCKKLSLFTLSHFAKTGLR